VILDLGSVPVYARRALLDQGGVFFAFTDGSADSRHRDEGQRPEGEAQAPARRGPPLSNPWGTRCEPPVVAKGRG
jgi:hypothetical protein